jgi:hypothetical protein
LKPTVVKRPGNAGLFLCSDVAHGPAVSGIFLAFGFLSGAVLPHATYFRVKTSRACRGIDARAGFLKRNRADALPFRGYPVSLSTKKRGCLVAYSHSTREHFENAFSAPIKSKYFMTVLCVIVTKMTATWHFDSARFFNLLLSSRETASAPGASTTPPPAA